MPMTLQTGNYADEIFDDNFWKEATSTYKAQYKDYIMYEEIIIVYLY